MEVDLGQGVFQAIRYAIWLKVKVGNVNKIVLHKIKKNLFIGPPSFIGRVNINCQPNLNDIVLVFYFSMGRFKKRSTTN
jgi:hypothetical protein